MTSGLTPKQLQVLSFIRQFVSEHGHAPTFREIGAGCGIKSTSNVHRYLDALEARGHVNRLPRAGRSVAVVEQASAA